MARVLGFDFANVAAGFLYELGDGQFDLLCLIEKTLVSQIAKAGFNCWISVDFFAYREVFVAF